MPRRHHSKCDPSDSQHPYQRPSDPAKRHSAALTDGPDRAAARAMLKAIGFTDDDLAKPLIGVATTWIETMPCNYNQRRLAQHVKDGIRAAGGTPMEFNTVSVSDGVSMGTEGMKASLISREVVADSIELVVRGHLLDGVVCLVGCDKTIPGAAMALGRLDRPGVILYNGTIYPGTYKGVRNATVVTVFEAIGAYRAGKITLDELYEVEQVACPGPGACGGQYTANTMSTVMEFMGLSPAGLNGIPAEDPAKDEAARQTGELVMDLVRRDVRPSEFVTRKSLENGIASRRRDRRLHQRRPASARHRPRVRRAARHRRVRRHRRPHADSSPTCIRAAATRRPTCTTPAGWSWSCASCSSATACSTGTCRPSTAGRSRRSPRRRRRRAGQKVVLPIETPLKTTGGLAILRGTLAPDGCVVKLAGHERRLHRGPARVFDSEAACFEAVKERRIVAGDVVVIRWEGPVGGPGMQEMLSVTGRAGRRGPGRQRGAHHRRPVLGRYPRADDRPHRAGGRARRADRRRPRGRRDRHRRRPQGGRPGRARGRDRAAPRRLDTAPAELPDRRAGQVRGPRRVGVAGRGHDRAADDGQPLGRAARAVERTAR